MLVVRSVAANLDSYDFDLRLRYRRSSTSSGTIGEMGTDRSEYVRRACLCGAGEIVINHAAPDHPFGAGKFNWELWLRCDECSKQYALIHQDKYAVLVRREEIEQREAKNNAILKRERELAQSDEVQGYIRRMAELIANQDTERESFGQDPIAPRMGSAVSGFQKTFLLMS